MLKAEAINQAYAAIRISGLTTEQVPEETEVALRDNAKIVITQEGISPTLLLGSLPVTVGSSGE